MVSVGRLLKRKQKKQAVKAEFKSRKRALKDSNDSDDDSSDGSTTSDGEASSSDHEKAEVNPLVKDSGKSVEKQPVAALTEEDQIIKKQWKNRTRLLVFCSRGCSYKERHLMQDLRAIMPHARTESKLDKKLRLPIINEIAAMKNCSKCIYFENRKRKDFYMWLANIGKGPSLKFLVHNVHTMAELKLSGNCLKGSRPILSFDQSFDHEPHLKVAKELLTQSFGTPNQHPRSQPFVDHVLSFSATQDGKIWFRNYQIVNETGTLEEIGPRMVLELIKVFEGSFGGAVLYENEAYVSPNLLRRHAKVVRSAKYELKSAAKKASNERHEKFVKRPTVDPMEEQVFETPEDVDSAHAIKRKLEKPARKKNKKNKKPKSVAVDDGESMDSS